MPFLIAETSVGPRFSESKAVVPAKFLESDVRCGRSVCPRFPPFPPAHSNRGGSREGCVSDYVSVDKLAPERRHTYVPGGQVEVVTQPVGVREQDEGQPALRH